MSESKFVDVPSFAELRHTSRVAITWRPGQLEHLAQRVRDCRRCSGLNLDPPAVPKSTRSAPGYGDPLSPVVIVGQSLCGEPCIREQIPFTGGSGRLLDRAFEFAGVAKSELFITNVVHCHPPKNRASLPHEVSNCAEYLVEELRIMHPSVVIALGTDARKWLRDWALREQDQITCIDRWSDPVEPLARRVLLAPHPRWTLMQPAPQREEHVKGIAAAIRWAFATRV